jgi:thiamine pyrophosphate-dependent acetolactate synthase large subunit-like protein
LTGSKVDEVTAGIQEDILAALEEMIAALQKAQRDMEQKKQQQQQQQQQQGEPGEQPLVEQIAELKLIRTMETRILSTTQRYSKIAAESPDAADLLQLVRDLAQRQSNLYRVTRDIVQKRNR